MEKENELYECNNTNKKGTRIPPKQDIMVIQRTLNLMKIYDFNNKSLVIDGIFDNETLSKIKEFQAKNKLVVDGIVGKNTWNILLK